MKIGIDFDNTIVSYDRAFYETACALRLIPSSVSPSKIAVKEYLCSHQRGDQWTELQGVVYGSKMELAFPYIGFEPFVAHCAKEKIPIFIISFRSLYPFLGPQNNLHQSARKWLSTQPFGQIPAYFESTIEGKLERIALLQCHYFIDDLPDIFSNSHFPKNVQKILFDPFNAHENALIQVRCKSWDEISHILFPSPA